MAERKNASRKSSDPTVLPFVKMHGLGNDYIYLDMFRIKSLPGDLAELARRVADRHFGVGGDGLILVGPSDTADLSMRMFNADGSEAQMCGNGIRCVAKLAYEAGHVTGRRITVQTGAGIKTLELITSGGETGTGQPEAGQEGSKEISKEGSRVEAVRVNMGAPKLAPADIPVKLPGERAVNVPIVLANRRFDMTCVSMGNPHAVLFCRLPDIAIEGLDLNLYGPAIERHPMFPERVNAHFVRVHSRTEVTMRTWERGSGITLACGTGASAVCVAGVLNRLTDRRIIAHLPGGDLELFWNPEGGEVFMTGPATEVFRGEWKMQNAK